MLAEVPKYIQSGPVATIPNPTFQAQISFAHYERQLFVFQCSLRVAAFKFPQ
jgi:hypothetical protein